MVWALKWYFGTMVPEQIHFSMIDQWLRYNSTTKKMEWTNTPPEDQKPYYYLDQDGIWRPKY